MNQLENSAALNWHPQREFLFAELHSRPFQAIPSNACITHMALLADQEQAEAQRVHICNLLVQLGYEQPVRQSPCVVLQAGRLSIRFERHLEFTSFTLTVLREERSKQQPFEHTALDRLPAGWLEMLPGVVVSAFHVHVENAPEGDLPQPNEVRHLFDGMDLISGSPQQDAARVWTSFQVHKGGFARFLVYNRDMSDTQMGRMLQRLMELETYRLMALLGFSEARQLTSVVTRMDVSLADLTQRLADRTAEDESDILARLTDMAAEIEAYRARTTFRFNASYAYYEILLERLESLDEDERAGHLTLGQFLTRRLSPAVRSCRTMQVRLDDLSRRIARASDMMRTRVELGIQHQNRELLWSMNRRSRIQLMMQHTVEGLSVAAISYYAVGLIKYLTEAIYTYGVPINKDLVTGLSVPVVIAGVWLLTRRIHGRYRHLVKADQEEQYVDRTTDRAET